MVRQRLHGDTSTIAETRLSKPESSSFVYHNHRALQLRPSPETPVDVLFNRYSRKYNDSDDSERAHSGNSEPYFVKHGHQYCFVQCTLGSFVLITAFLPDFFRVILVLEATFTAQSKDQRQSRRRGSLGPDECI